MQIAMSDSEPGTKRLKLETIPNDSVISSAEKTSLGQENGICDMTTKPSCVSQCVSFKDKPRVILHDKYYRSLETVKVHTCQVLDKKQTSRLLREVNEVYKLKGLEHLKRVSSQDGWLKIIIASVPDDVAFSCHVTLKKLFDGTSVNTDGLSEPSITLVPKYPPLTREQYNDWSKIWPTTFHEDKYISKLINGDIFGADELYLMGKYMDEAIQLAVRAKDKGMNPIGAVLVNPEKNKILCRACDLSRQHPLRHASMVCIDLVAKLRGGGAWELDTNPDLDEKSMKTDRLESNEELMDQRRTEKDKHDLMWNNGDFSAIGNTSFAATANSDTCPRSSSLEKNETENGRDLLATKFISSDQDSSYLCTGCDLYITQEPCVMCAMALLHSRIRRVFYSCPFAAFGGLGSQYKIHTLAGTNHRFEVFSGLSESKCHDLFPKKELEVPVAMGSS